MCSRLHCHPYHMNYRQLPSQSFYRLHLFDRIEEPARASSLFLTRHGQSLRGSRRCPEYYATFNHSRSVVYPVLPRRTPPEIRHITHLRDPPRSDPHRKNLTLRALSIVSRQLCWVRHLLGLTCFADIQPILTTSHPPNPNTLPLRQTTLEALPVRPSVGLLKLAMRVGQERFGVMPADCQMANPQIAVAAEKLELSASTADRRKSGVHAQGELNPRNGSDSESSS